MRVFHSLIVDAQSFTFSTILSASSVLLPFLYKQLSRKQKVEAEELHGYV